FDAELAAAHAARADTGQPREHRGGASRTKLRDARVVAPILVSKGRRQQKIRHAEDSGLRQARCPCRADSRKMRDRVGETDPRGLPGRNRRQAPESKNLSATSPNFNRSPFLTATGVPVARRESLT